MDENVMRVLQMLQDGKISAQEAETLIAALRGESTTPSGAKEKEKEEKEDKAFFGGFDFVDKIKTPKIDLDDWGERISRAVAKVQPEKIVRRVQAQLRTATKTGAHWGATMSARVRVWTEGEDTRPENTAGLPEQNDVNELEFHLEPGASVLVENPLGNVKLTGIADGPAAVVVRKTVWAARSEDLKATADRIEVNINGTDSKLDVKISAPDVFREGTVDLELRVPRSANTRVSTHFGSVEVAEMEGRSEAVTRSGALYLHDLAGDARGETASGELRLERIRGMATVATQSGDIQAEDIQRGLTANTASGDVRAVGIEGGRVECKSVSGDVSTERIGLQAPLDITVESVSGDTSLSYGNGNIALKAVSGDVSANHLTATRLQAQTISGDVKVHLTQPFSGTMQLNTVSGDVTLDLPEGSNVRVSLSTTSGDLKCEHEAQNVVASETLWSGQIGTGAGTLNVQTISGDTHVRRAVADSPAV
jgi:DUF4097 and DUF4098 domain-containing protein YvlB